MRVEILFQGFPGKLASGYLQWSSVIFVESKGTRILFDTAGPGKRGDICKRLAGLGVKPEDIDILVLSHFHDDHVYNFDFFSKARILLHKKEAEWLQNGPGELWQPKFLYPVMERTGRLELVDADKEIAPGVQTLLLPGHTPGCMALVLQADAMPTTVLAGDAIKNLSELATGKTAMSVNAEETAQSIKKVRSFARIVIPGHDRTLEVRPDCVAAITALHETIIVPSGVVDHDKSRNLELVLEPTWLPIQ